MGGQPSKTPKIIGGTTRMFCAEALVVPTGLVTAGILTRQLGAGDYGAFVLASTLVAWVEWTLVSLFSRASIKLIADAEQPDAVASTVLRIHLLVGAVAAAVLWLAAGAIGSALGAPSLGGHLRLFALDVPLFCLTHAHRAALIGTAHYTGQTAAIATRWIARLALIAAFVLGGLSVTGAIYGILGATALELAVQRYHIRPPLAHRDALPMRELLVFAVPLFLYAMTLRLFDKLDLFALKALGGSTEQSGYYGAAQNLALIPGLFAASFSPVLLASISHALRERTPAEAKSMARTALRFTFWVLPFATFAAGAAPEIVTLVYGREFAAAATPLALLVFGAWGLMTLGAATAILTAAGKIKWPFRIVSPLVPAAIAIHVAAIPKFGSTGAALTTSGLALGAAIAAIAAVYALWRIAPSPTCMARAVVLGAAAYALAAWWPTPGLALLAKLGVACLAIPLALLVTGELDARELAWTRDRLRGRAAGECRWCLSCASDSSVAASSRWRCTSSCCRGCRACGWWPSPNPIRARRDRARQRAPGLRAFEEHAALLRAGIVDAVIIGVPYDQHAAATIAALDAGVHVYLEKPFSVTVDDARAMVQANERADAVAMMGFNYRFHPLYASMRTAIRAGRIGEPVAMRSVFAFAPKSGTDWDVTRHPGTGAIFDLAPHHIDLARFLFDAEVEQVAAQVRSVHEPDDTASIQLRLGNGVLAQLLLSTRCVEDDRVACYGTGGVLAADHYRSLAPTFQSPRKGRFDRLRGLARLVEPVTRASYLVEKLRSPWHEPSFGRALRHFAAAARGEVAATPDFQDGYRNQLVLDAALRSVESGRFEDVGDA